MTNANFNASAEAAQAIATAQAMAMASDGDILPLPPYNLPALRSIPGRGCEGAAVLGYFIRAVNVNDCIAPDGTRKVPGDKGFLEAQYGRLGLMPMPPGWMIEWRDTHKLYALVAGNPILLETTARRAGYARATAISPTTLDLGEIEIDEEEEA